MKRIIAATIGGIGLALVVPQTAYAATANRPADHRSDVTYTMADVAKHAKAEDCWTAVKDKVYDLTLWLKTPEGVASAGSIALICGVDSTTFFKPAKVEPTHTSGYDDDGDDDGDHNGDHRGSQHRSIGAVKGASHDSDSDNWGHTQNPTKALYKSIKHYKIGRLGLVATTAPAVTPPAMTPPAMTPPATTPTTTTTTPGSYTLAQIAPHNTAADCWTAIGTNVYNLTSYISTHPGGVGTISALCGTNGTTKFNNQHAGATKPAAILTGLKVGALVA